MIGLEVGKHYSIRIKIGGRIEEYPEGRVLEILDDEFRYETEDDNTLFRALTIRNSELVSFREIKADKKEKTHFISSKKQYNNLTESVHPEF